MSRGSVPAPSRLFTLLIGATCSAILLQAITAGVFVNQDGRDSWVSVHGVIADVTWVVALAAAVVAFVRMRHTQRLLWRAAAVLFVLLLAQTGVGHLITDGGVDGLIVVHVPLAMLIFGLAVWLSVATARASRGADSPMEPYADEPAQPLSVANRR